jgi:hypothetical protein
MIHASRSPGPARIGHVGDRNRHRYGAIRWRPSAPLDDAIRAVRGFDDPDAAVRFIQPTCGPEERWAVVELKPMRIIAAGSAS